MLMPGVSAGTTNIEYLWYGGASGSVIAVTMMKDAIEANDENHFSPYLVESFVLGLADGPTEVHKVTLARLLLRDQEPAPDMFPSEHLLRLRDAAEAKFADRLAGIPRD